MATDEPTNDKSNQVEPNGPNDEKPSNDQSTKPNDEKSTNAEPNDAKSANALPSANDSSKPTTNNKRKRDDDKRGPPAKMPRAETLVVFGLGSSGTDKELERHNVGQRVLASLAKALEASPVDDQDGAVGVEEVPGRDRPWLLLPPQGDINNSGEALKNALAAMDKTGAAPLIIVDDVAIPFGTLRFRAKGSSGGHNGLLNIEGEFGQNYNRLKIGIGGTRSQEHVTGKFLDEEELFVKEKIIPRATEAAQFWLTHGPEDIQNILQKVNNPAFCKLPGPPESSLEPGKGGRKLVAENDACPESKKTEDDKKADVVSEKVKAADAPMQDQN